MDLKAHQDESPVGLGRFRFQMQTPNISGAFRLSGGLNQQPFGSEAVGLEPPSVLALRTRQESVDADPPYELSRCRPSRTGPTLQGLGQAHLGRAVRSYPSTSSDLEVHCGCITGPLVPLFGNSRKSPGPGGAGGATWGHVDLGRSLNASGLMDRCR